MSPRSMRLASDTSCCGREQLDPADLLEVHAHRVGGGHVHAQIKVVRASRPFRLFLPGVELQLFVGVEAGLVDDLDALVEQRWCT